jgi:hypothetical protein
MKPLIVFALVIFIILAGCKKSNPFPYSGNFYIRIPLAEGNDAYYGTENNIGGLYIVNANLRKMWTLFPAGVQEYNIGPADDSASTLITDWGTALYLAPRDSTHPDTQIFKIIPVAADKSVYFQSVASGKFIQLEYCFKGTETWGYGTLMNDSTHCSAYQDITFSNLADTCYCVDRYILDRN